MNAQSILTHRISEACKATHSGTRARSKALASVKWRLRYGLLCAGLDSVNHTCVLVSSDDSRVQTFDGRDNEAMKARYYGAVLGCQFEVELL